MECFPNKSWRGKNKKLTNEYEIHRIIPQISIYCSLLSINCIIISLSESLYLSTFNVNMYIPFGKEMGVKRGGEGDGGRGKKEHLSWSNVKLFNAFVKIMLLFYFAILSFSISFPFATKTNARFFAASFLRWKVDSLLQIFPHIDTNTHTHPHKHEASVLFTRKHNFILCTSMRPCNILSPFSFLSFYHIIFFFALLFTFRIILFIRWFMATFNKYVSPNFSN